jgi:hypothetical protein
MYVCMLDHYIRVIFTYSCDSCLKQYTLKNEDVTQFTVLMQDGKTDRGKEDGVKDNSPLSFSGLLKYFMSLKSVTGSSTFFLFKIFLFYIVTLCVCVCEFIL